MSIQAMNENFNENQIKAIASYAATNLAATTTTRGTVLRASVAAAATVPFADLTAAANYVNALRAAFIAAGQAQ